MLYFFHFSLAVILFLLQNWISSKAYSAGYIKFSLLDEKDEAISLNYLLKVFGPIVFLIVSVAALQYWGLNAWKEGIVRVIYFYLCIRVGSIFLYERVRIVNWLSITIYYLSILVLAHIITAKFIDQVDSLLPDFSEIKNEIWLLVIIFFYQLGNGIAGKENQNDHPEASRAYLPELKKRKKRYILRKYDQLENEYGRTITSITKGNKSLDLLILCILIYENFNRPRVIRMVERLWCRISKKLTTQGIMQQPSKLPITDIESVSMGANALKDYFESDDVRNSSYKSFALTLKRHCPDKKFIRQVLFIAKAIIENGNTQKANEQLYTEIKMEFDLY